jgi:hypothetical protein
VQVEPNLTEHRDLPRRDQFSMRFRDNGVRTAGARSIHLTNRTGSAQQYWVVLISPIEQDKWVSDLPQSIVPVERSACAVSTLSIDKAALR